MSWVAKPCSSPIGGGSSPSCALRPIRRRLNPTSTGDSATSRAWCHLPSAGAGPATCTRLPRSARPRRMAPHNVSSTGTVMTAVVYAESSAVLAWLLRESTGASVRAQLDAAGTVVTSRLTMVECARNLRRARSEGRLADHDARAAQHTFGEAAGQWVIMDLVGDVMSRAEEDLP